MTAMDRETIPPRVGEDITDGERLKIVEGDVRNLVNQFTAGFGGLHAKLDTLMETLENRINANLEQHQRWVRLEDRVKALENSNLNGDHE